MYNDLIIEHFKRLHLSPRDNQVEVINDILTSFLDDKCKNVILSAPTGCGKSIINIIISSILYEKFSPTDSQCWVMMNSNSLVEQYKEDFCVFNGISYIKGANNFTCEDYTLEYGNTIDASYCNYNPKSALCGRCLFNKLKLKKKSSKTIITNYNYFLSSLLSGNLEDNIINVYDEAHTLLDTYIETYKLTIDDNLLSQIYNFIKKYKKDFEDIDLNKIKEYKNNLKNISLDNYREYTNNFYEDIIKEIYDILEPMLPIIKQKRSEKYIPYLKLSQLIGVIKEKLFILNINSDSNFHVFESMDDGFIIKPTIIQNTDFMKKSVFNLFTSATISEEFMRNIMKDFPGKTKFIKLPPIFPKENKKIIFYKPLNLNFKTIQLPDTISKIKNSCVDIIKLFPQDKGLILTPSFDITEKIKDILKNNKTHKLFVQERGKKLYNVLEEFKKYDKPSILISPSSWEGISLDDDLSKFQIIVKMPYPNLKEKRMEWILNNKPQLYQIQSLLKLIQGMGRSSRNKDDKSVIFCLDTNIQRIFNSSINIWKDEFLVTSFY